MPPASTSAARRAPRRAPARSRPASRADGLVAAASRVRWDRVGRVALLLLLAGVVGLYIQPAFSYVSTWRESKAQHARLRDLTRQHEQLLQQARALRSPRTIETEARRLGMVRPGERPYVVEGLPRG